MAWGLEHVQKTWFGFTLPDPELQVEPQPGLRGVLWWISQCVLSININVVNINIYPFGHGLEPQFSSHEAQTGFRVHSPLCLMGSSCLDKIK